MKDLKWYEFSQNNSGGYFIQTDSLCEYVLIEAISYEDAKTKLTNLVDSDNAWGYCECCGERWCLWGEEDGTDSPTIWGESIYTLSTSYGREQCILHHYEGKIERVVLGESK